MAVNKAHISLSYFNDDFGYSKIKEGNITDDNIKFFIDRASQYVNGNVVGNAINAGIRNGLYEQDADGNLTIKDQTLADLDFQKEKLEAYRECVALLTKFGLDTGFDFLTGSMSRNMGGESYAETLNYTESLASLIQVIKGNLANFD
ncbi:UNVERIFIED_CONTAM: hypothetical protein RF648_19765 [Kocuria sp. CPCC 205274]